LADKKSRLLIGVLTLVAALLAACSAPPTSSTPGIASPTWKAVYTLAETGASNNDAWKPFSEVQNGVPMALAPAGCFMMGSTDEHIAYLMGVPGSSMQRSAFNDQQPPHEVCFDKPFWIDVYEVTQAQFAEQLGEAAHENAFIGNALPRERITWIEANAYCRKRGARLPTEAEWEYAARGPDGWIFPWGNGFDCTRGNFDDTLLDDPYVIEGYPNCDGFPETAPVGSITSGASWIGAMDMSGNVWEWVADRYSGDTYKKMSNKLINPQGPSHGELRVVRGGAWSINEPDHLGAAFRGGIDPGTSSEHLGFRCALSY
jgi:formylglycine-generating enzyme required for sulfatase activity